MSRLIERRKLVYGEDHGELGYTDVYRMSKLGQLESLVAGVAADIAGAVEDDGIINSELLQARVIARHNLRDRRNRVGQEGSVAQAASGWKLLRVIAGSHTGWIRSLCVEPENSWFASGSVDSTIKVWDLALLDLKLTLTGHIMAVRGLAISDRHPYMFSCSEDKTIKCWDLEKNKVIRDFYGHLSGVYCLDIHPQLDVIVSGGRDSSVRVWDMRTRVAVQVMTGHESNVLNVRTRAVDPQVVSSSSDRTIRLWDIVAGKSVETLTNHSKSVRSMALSGFENSFVTGSSGEIKKWGFPKGVYIEDFEASEGIINTLSVNDDGVCFAGGDDGSMRFFDYQSGLKTQEEWATSIPGTKAGEGGIFASTFDKTGLRLITGEGDKSIKIWGNDD